MREELPKAGDSLGDGGGAAPEHVRGAARGGSAARCGPATRGSRRSPPGGRSWRPRSAAAAEAVGVTVHRGVTVIGVTTHETGARRRGSPVCSPRTGRRSTRIWWWTAAGGARPCPRGCARPAPGAPVEERADCGFVYYGRHFRSGYGRAARALANYLQHYDSLSIITLPGGRRDLERGVDRAAAGTRRCAALRDPARWRAALAALPAGRALARRRADLGRRRDGRRRRPAPPVGHRRCAGGHGCGRARRRVGGHQSLGRPRRVDGADPRLPPAGPAARHRPRGPRQAGPPVRRGHRQGDRTAVPDNAVVRPAPAGRNRRRPGRRAVPADDQRWHAGKALFAASLTDPELARAYTSIAAFITLPSEVFATPGVPERVAALGASAPQYPLPGPARTELLDAIA